jgi:hypothetical protein
MIAICVPMNSQDTLRAALEAFIRAHWMTCTCGAAISRRIDDD